MKLIPADRLALPAELMNYVCKRLRASYEREIGLADLQETFPGYLAVLEMVANELDRLYEPDDEDQEDTQP